MARFGRWEVNYLKFSKLAFAHIRSPLDNCHSHTLGTYRNILEQGGPCPTRAYQRVQGIGTVQYLAALLL